LHYFAFFAAALCERRLNFAAAIDCRYSQMANNFVNKKNNFVLLQTALRSLLVA